jgi:hypothetical protein
MLISIDPPLVLFLLFLGYAASGPVVTLVRHRKLKDRKQRRAA